MNYASFTFLFLFLPIAMGVYYLTPKRFRARVLLLLSAVFSLLGGLVSSAVIFLLTGAAWGIGVLLWHLRDRQKASRLVCIGAAILYFAILVFLRSPWLQRLQGDILQGSDFYPLGLSFFVLFCIGYWVDILRGKLVGAQNFWDFALFLLFFPRRLWGPVVSFQRSRTAIEQAQFSPLQIGFGLSRFLVGLAKKLLLADWVVLFHTHLMQSDPSAYSFLILWIGALAKFLALLFEFSGYCDMALGLGLCFGIHMPENYGRSFYYPSLTLFVDQWNHTVHAWFLQYCSIPIHQKKPIYHILPVALVWGIIFLWYDFRAENFLFGFCLGLCTGLEFYWKHPKMPAVRALLPTWFCVLGAALLSGGFGERGQAYLQGMFFMGHILPTDADAALLFGFWFILALCIYVSTGHPHILLQHARRYPRGAVFLMPLRLVGSLLLLLLCAAALVRAGGSVEMQLLL